MEQEFVIDNVVVDREIFTVKFVCDITKCHGLCCYSPDEGAFGPPLTYDEVKLIKEHKEFLSEIIPEDSWHEPSKRKGLARTKPVGLQDRTYPYRVRLHGDTCIFCSNKGCVLKDIHKLTQGNIPIEEPISCSLYPITEGTDATGTAPFIYVEHYYDETYCKAAYEKGEREGTYLLDFLQEPLIRRFGVSFFNHLKEVQKNVLSGKY